MKRIVVNFMDGSYTNIPGDKLILDRDYSMILAYSGENLVGAFEITTVLKIHISERSETTNERQQ